MGNGLGQVEGSPGASFLEQGVTLEDFGIRAGVRRPPWVDPMTFYRAVLGYRPYRHQEAFHRSGARVKIVAGAKRIGKSYMAAREVEPLILTPETRGWFVGATYRRAVKEFEYVWNDLVVGPPRGLGLGTLEKNYNVRGGYMNLRFAQNSVVEVRSAKDENDLEAEPLDWVVLCEPTQLKESVFELLRERVAERRGVMILPGTPPLSRHWLKRRFDRGADPAWEDYWSIRIPATETPYPGADEVEKLRRELSELRFRRDVLAEFVATEEIVYSEWDYTTHVEDLEYDPDLPLYWGFDFGYASPWVCLWFQVDRGKERVYILDEYHQRHRSDADNIAAVKEYHDAQGYARTVTNVADPHGAASRRELENQGVFTRADAGSHPGDIDRGLEIVRQFLKPRGDGRPGIITNRTCEHTVDEWNLYHYAKGDKPADEDNHCLDVVRYFLQDQFGDSDLRIDFV